MNWPPELEDLKDELDVDDTRDDTRLTRDLNAAIAFVERVRKSSFNFAGDLDSELPDPTDDLILGTLRLAARWKARLRSPDGLIQMAELGSGRVPPFDSDIERLLGIGRFAGATFA